ncbi:MAG: glycosyltransferase family 2 protein [Planctomycetota bacterium]|nr:glycosyltransferase family 2 protein [Planctomycetota bacterium]
MSGEPGPDRATGASLPSLGVGICALNEERALPRLLSRLLQTADDEDRPAEVVVADGGSDDRTVELAERMGARVIAAGRGRGVQLASAAEALQEAEGGHEVLLFLHADCVPRPGALAELRRAFAGRGTHHAAALRQTIVAEGRVWRWLERAANARARRGIVYGDSGLAVTPDVYRECGGYPPWPLFEDVALSKAIRRLTRVEVVETAALAVSPRRWEEEGVLRCTLRNLVLRAAFECGAPPRRLARWYRALSGRAGQRLQRSG